MCGRTSETADEAELQRYLDNLNVSWQRPPKYGPRWNIPPSQPLITVSEEAVGRVARDMRWGWFRPWSKRLISNATREKIATANTFKSAFRSTRGVVVVDGYYEWRQNPDRSTTPFRIHKRGGGLFTMAALWESGHSRNDGVTSCTIVTDESADAMLEIHDRIPVILTDAAALEWINPDTGPEALQAIIADSVRDLEMYEVTSYVGSSRREGPQCWEPAEA